MVFNTRNQQPGETVDQYATILRKKVKTCEFGTLTESLIKDRLVCGVISDKTRPSILFSKRLQAIEPTCLSKSEAKTF